MRKQITLFLKYLGIALLLLNFTLLSAQSSKVSFENNWGKQGITLKSQDNNGLIINTSINAYIVNETMVDNKTMQTITTKGVMLQNDEGAPNIPSYSNYIAVPQGAKVVAKVIRKQSEYVNNIEVAPSPIIPKDDDNSPLVYTKNSKIYSNNQFYPNNIVKISEPLKIRGVDVVIVAISPFQYNPVTKQMIVNRDIEVEITFEGGNDQFGEDRLRNRWWDPIIKDAVLNNASIKATNKSSRGTRETGYEYLIIVPDDPIFISWADSLKEFRIKQGISTNVLTTTEVGGNTVAAIEGYVNNAYNTWDIPPAAVLLMADYGTSGSTIISPIWDNYCVSDNIFADVDNDQMPDVIFARMTAQNEEHLETMVTKVLNYERNPPTSPDFYNHPITALGWQTERWFQICSETVGGFFQTVQGKNPVRINEVYDGNPSVDPWSTATNTSTVLTQFGPDGLGYIPESPSDLGGWSGGNSTDVNNAINAGAFILQHRDHGDTDGWGEPGYSNSNINGLTNTDLPFIFSINCLTGKYNISGECFAEKFHRYKYNGNNSGALGIIAASEVSYSFVNDTYVWGMYDNMWPDFLPDYGSTPESRGVLPAFGNAGGKYFLQQSSWPYNTNNKEVTYNLFHHHGDAFSVVYSEVPQNLTVVHDAGIIAGETSFVVSADAGSFIALTVDNQIIGTAEGTGDPVSITIAAQMPPNHILVTITKQNYYRYESYVEVIPPSGPYVIFNDIIINDANGNNNGIMETGESILSTISMKNIGVEIGENIDVIISTSDSFIILSDDNEEYGNIAAGEILAVADGFAWEVANNIPDLHDVIFDIEATDGTDIWASSTTITAHAPSLSIGQMVIDDSDQGNGNGRLDAGETVDLIFDTYNDGSFVAIATLATLESGSQFITLNNTEFNIGDIESNTMSTAIFNITIDGETPIGSPVEFIYDVASGEYGTVETFSRSVGLILEDWETGDMTQFDWQTGGSGNWTVSTTDPYEGAYCNQSGTISDDQNTWLSITYDVSSDDTVSFYAMVSSEDNYDFFKFYIDGNSMVSLSGSESWQRFAIPVSEGTHTFKWEYTKDGSVSSGDDLARIDYIVLPVPIVTSAFAGPDTDYCESDIMQCNGTATACTSTLWTTSGSGTFDDDLIPNPIYQPSSDDIENGAVVLTFTGYGETSTVSDDVIFNIGKTPIAFSGESGLTCSNEQFYLDAAYAENYTSILWTTMGDGTFDDASAINPVYLVGATDIENGVTFLIMTVDGFSACEPATHQLELLVDAAPVVYAGESQSICGYEITLESAYAENYTSIEWTTIGDGTFDDATAVNPIYTFGATDIENGLTSLTMTVSGSGTCESASQPLDLLIGIQPVAYAGETGSTCESEPFNLEAAYAENYTSIEWTTLGDGTFDDASLVNPNYTVGATDIETGVTSLIMTVTGSEICEPATHQLELLVAHATEANAGEDADICPMLTYTLEDANANNYAEILWTTSGDGTFDDTSIEHPTYTPGENDLLTKEITLTLSAISETVCPTVGDEMLLTLYCTDITNINKLAKIELYPNPNTGNFTLKLDGVINESANIRVFNSNGKMVYAEFDVQLTNSFRSTINIDVLPGIYTIRIEGNTTRIAKKFIVK